MFILSKIFVSPSSRGSILISHLLAAGFIGISVVALLSYMQGMHSQIQKVEQEQDVSFNIHSNIISSLRALLVSVNIDDTGAEQAQSTEGICSFLKQPNKASGVELVQFNLNSSSGFPESRWEFFLNKSEYEISSNAKPCEAMDPGFVSNKFSRCFKYIGKKEETANEAYIIARVVPKQFPSFTAIDLSQNNTLDAKTVLFELQSLTAVFKDDSYSSTGISPSKQYGLIWANAVSECHITSTNNKKLVVLFSGSGPGRLSRRTVINNADFGNVNKCADLEFQDVAPHTRITHSILPDGSIGIDQNSRARLACRRKVFLCKNKNTRSSDDYDPVIFNLGISNDSGGILDLKKIRLTFVDENSAAVSSGGSGKLTVEVYDRARDFDANEALTDVPLNAGHSVYKFTIKDKSAGDNSLKAFCDDACTSGNKVFPKVQIDLDKAAGATCTSYSSDYESDNEHQFRCIACHSKICTKYGVGTFGLIENLVDEPLDGTIPECKLPNNNNKSKYDLPSPTPTGTGDCVAMTGLNSADDFKFKSVSYEFRSCDSRLPVLCFAYGHYIPAVKISSPTSNPAIFTGEFHEAQKACYNMGRELVKKTDLGGFFKIFWNPIAGDTDADVAAGLGLPGLSGNANYFDYVNNATRGIFIAPSYDIDEISDVLKNGYIQKFIDGPHNKAWVAMRKDGGGQLIGSIPWAPVASSNVAIFRRKVHPYHAVLLKNTTISSSGTDTVLTHNIQYKGVYNVDGSSGTKKALCRKVDSSGNFKKFVFSADTSLANAPTACITAGAKFLPPVSSLEWVKAMTLIKPNEEAYPFPDPGDLSGDTNHIYSLSVNAPSRWVALSNKTAGNGNKTESWRLSDVYFPDIPGPPVVNSIFKHTDGTGSDMPDKDSDYIGIIDAKGRPQVPISLTVSSVRNFNINTLKKACYTDDNDQVTLESAVKTANSSCDSGQQEVDEDFLKEKRKSVIFMSEWVEKGIVNVSDNLLINKGAIDELKQRANNIHCKSPRCPNCVGNCNNTCSSGSYGVYTCEADRINCRNNCPLACSDTVPGPPVPDAACITACGSDATCAGNCGTVPGPDVTISVQCSSCLSGCNSTANTCKANCRSDCISDNCYTCTGTPSPTNCTEQCDCEFPLDLSSPVDFTKQHDWTTTVLP